MGSICSVTDEELVLLARQRDTSAFDQLVVRHQAAVCRTALAALRVPEDAEDVAQEAFVRAWSTLKRFRGEASFKTWLLTIAWNRAINRRRMRMNWWRRAAPLTDTLVLVASGDAPDEDLRSRELRTHIRRAIEALTPKLRDALLLAQSGEYAYDEIGTLLRISEGTVKWRVSEARRRVRQRLAALGYSCDRARDDSFFPEDSDRYAFCLLHRALSIMLGRRYAEEGRMAALEGRVGNLEGRMQEQSLGIADLKNDVARLDVKLSESVVRLDAKISESEARLDARISGLDDKISRQFVWLVGMLVTVLAAVVGGVLSR